MLENLYPILYSLNFYLINVYGLEKYTSVVWLGISSQNESQEIPAPFGYKLKHIKISAKYSLAKINIPYCIYRVASPSSRPIILI